jgi:hypothetical protein
MEKQDFNQLILEINKKVRIIEGLKEQIKNNKDESYQEWLNKRKIANIIEVYKTLKSQIVDLEIQARKMI